MEPRYKDTGGVGGFWGTRAAPVDYRQEKQKNAKVSSAGSLYACSSLLQRWALAIRGCIALPLGWSLLFLAAKVSAAACEKGSCAVHLGKRSYSFRFVF
ncbi:hypothetical protein NDU88_004459 [Pleurodeles waltl]|uniref:Uncharacterized protein n=1 Tax=Pleurodeles waltl TaxID=8319 RepID=A0AAV7TRJ1_PLEWA|nr:hypothetical protein NDU88_004459 [Pleurodeles waltl]